MRGYYGPLVCYVNGQVGGMASQAFRTSLCQDPQWTYGYSNFEAFLESNWDRSVSPDGGV